MLVAEREARLVNAHGLHARPSAQLTKLATTFESSIEVSTDSRSMDAKSIMSVLQLAAVKGTVLRFRAQGPDAEEAVEALAELVGRGFDGLD
jgi:phosphocarrier protein HPr